MPKSREEIKHDPVSREAWRDHRTGVMWFDPRQIRPLSNHILVELDVDHPFSESSVVMKPDSAVQDIGTRIGTILAVGPGKWHEDRSGWKEPVPSHILLPMVFRATQLKPGDRVVIGHYSDWESWNCSADGHRSQDANIALCQEADVRFVIA